MEIFLRDPCGFDLVITDMTMPHMTGLELSLKIAEIRFDIGIILCTGCSENNQSESLSVSAIRAFLMKPFSRSEMAF